LDWKIRIKQLILLISYVTLALGITFFFLVYVLNWTLPGIMVTMVYSGISSYMIFIYIVPSWVILKYHLKGNKRLSLIVVGICGLLVVTSILPAISTPSAIWGAESQFNDLYGEDYRELDTKNMLKEPYSIWRQFAGINIKDSEIEVEEKIEYYDNGDDTFYFDYYAPKDGDGPYPAIINIHGGAWFLGNRGPINNVAFSKYIAAQGYVVFDIQYGLCDIDEAADTADLELVADVLLEMLKNYPELREKVVPQYEKNYLIQDQVANIGKFTQFLANNSEEYEADIDNVFIMGRSAGAHMAGVVGCGYYNSKFSGVFDPNLTVRGVVLYYPPTDIKKMYEAMADGSLGAYPKLAPAFEDFLDEGDMSDEQLEKEYKKYSAAYLIQDDNKVPPIIVVHGNLDRIVPYEEQGLGFYEIAQEEDRDCILVTIPFAGHAFDIINAQSPGWQISTYYIERFLALEME